MTAKNLSNGVQFDLTDAIAARRNMLTLSGRLQSIDTLVISHVQRRLPVEARRDILREYNISAGRVNKDLRITPTNTGLRLTGFWRGIGLMSYGARQTREGVSYAVFKGAGRKTKKSAFIMGLRRGEKSKGNTHVVRRTSKARLPIEVQYGPTVAQMLRKQGRPERLADFAVGLVGKEMERLLAASLNETVASTNTD